MSKAIAKIREEARRLYLTGQSSSNAEIARHVKVKPHTIGRWRKEENWDDLRIQVSREEAKKLVEQIATDRIELNVKHFRYWDILLAHVNATLKATPPGKAKLRDLVELAGVLDRAQKGQRVARGLALDGQTEEQARAEAQSENRTLIDIFIDAIKKHVTDPEARDRIRESILAKMPTEDEPGEPTAA